MNWLWLVPVAALVLAAPVAVQARPRGKWADPGMPIKIRHYVAEIEAKTGPWPGLAEYLTAVAYWESRGNPRVQSGGTLGLYQMSPDVGCMEGFPASILYDPRLSTWMAACHVYALGSRYSSRRPTWLAIRRGWKYPALVDDYAERSTISADIRERFAEALRATKINPQFMFETAIPRTLKPSEISRLFEES